MGAAVYIVVEAAETGFDTFVNGKALSRAERKLAAAAKGLGVTPLMDFFGMGGEELDDFGASDDADAEPASAQWFPAEQGLRTVRALLGLLEADPKALGEGVKDELQEFSQVLEQAQRRGLRWHLAVDY